MRYFIPALLVVWLALGCAFVHAYCCKIGRVAVHRHNIVLLVTNHGVCTGFVISRGLVATAGHCIHPLDKTQDVIFSNGERQPYKVWSFEFKDDCTHDYALVFVNTGHRSPMHPTSRQPEATDPIFHAGHPYGARAQVLTLAQRIPGERFYITGTSLPGESGSPVWDEYGKVVGILTCGSQPPDEVTVVAPIEPIQRLLELL